MVKIELPFSKIINDKSQVVNTLVRVFAQLYANT